MVRRIKRLGRGLEDISHYFISQDQKRGDHSSLIGESGVQYHTAAIVDIFDPHRSALLTTSIGIELCKKGIRPLVIDADSRFPGIAFMLARSLPGYSFQHYLKRQYDPSDMIYTGPFDLKVLAPRLCIKDICKMRISDVSSMFEVLISVERGVDIILLRQFEDKLQLLTEEAVFVIPALPTSMIRAYRAIKTFASGIEGKKIGIVIANAKDESTAIKAYEKIYGCLEMSCDIKPFFCGYLPDESRERQTVDLPCISTIVSHMVETGFNNRDVAKGERLFFERLRYLIVRHHISSEEVTKLLS